MVPWFCVAFVAKKKPGEGLGKDWGRTGEGLEDISRVSDKLKKMGNGEVW